MYRGLAMMYRFGNGVPEDASMAIKLYKKAAKYGNGDAMCSVGYMYENGIGTKENPEEAADWYKKAVEAGNSTAMTNLGLMCRNGEGVEADSREAAELFEKATEAGDADAMWLLGDMYRAGEGITQDYQRAITLYRQAADAGESYAMFWLGVMYRDGVGVEEDLNQASEWFQKAADAGDEHGKEALQNLKQAVAVPNDDSWFRHPDFLTEFIYRLQQTVIPFDKDASGGFLSVYSCKFAFTEPISPYHDIFEDIPKYEDDMTVIAALEDRHPFSCGGIAFSTRAMYVRHLSSKKHKFVSYADIQYIEIVSYSNRDLKILTRNGQSVIIYCDVWNRRTIKLFLSVAAGLKDFSAMEIGILSDIRVEALGNRTVGEMIRG